MVVRMRHNRAQRKNTRSHHALIERAIQVCPDCKSPVLRHTACLNCGKYKGKMVINVQAKIDKKAKKMKEREKAQNAR